MAQALAGSVTQDEIAKRTVANITQIQAKELTYERR